MIRILVYSANKSLITLRCIKATRADLYIKDQIIDVVGAIFLSYFGLCNLFMILKGGEYIKSIEKKDDKFLIINVYNEKKDFNLCDVKSVSGARFSLVNFFLSGFSKQVPGLELILENGCKYRITSDMENLDSLKQHLLGMEG